MSAGIFVGVIATQEFALGLSQLGTDGSNPSPSSRQSVSLRNSPPLVRKLPFSAGVRAGAGGAVGRDAQRPANIRSTDGIISGGPYSSTAMPPDVVRNSAGTGPRARWVAWWVAVS